MLWKEKAEWRKNRVGFEVVIQGIDIDPIMAPSGESADFYRRFGVHGNPYDILLFVGLFVDLVYRLKYRVCFGYLFQGSVFFTFRR